MKLPILDLVVILAYLVGVVGLGCWFVRKSRTTGEFMAAGGALPGWAVGLSIFGTYVSSISFLALPGKAYAGNWNAFVFSLSLPLTALIAVRYFVLFYRKGGQISAYAHLEQRFGAWARSYAVLCYLLTQLARIGTIMYLVALVVAPLISWDVKTIIIITSLLVTLYTLMGGIEAVVWTDVAQSIVLISGVLASVAVLLLGMPQGPGQVFRIAAENGKFSLGSLGTSLAEPTFWVVLLYGIVINLQNFGIDQSYVQRYITARSNRQAQKSLWIGALLYLPISALLLFIGSSLYAYYQTHPAMLAEVQRQVAEKHLQREGIAPGDPRYAACLEEKAVELKPQDIGDSVFPHFIVRGLPVGVTGLLIAAILAAAMSTVSTSLNCSATLVLCDIYKRYLRPGAGERESMCVLYATTLLWGMLGTGTALAMMRIKTALDAWWSLAGIFAGGMLGLFLLGLISRRAKNAAGAAGVAVGVLVILWMTFSRRWTGSLAPLRSPFHDFLIIVVGTTTVLLVGLLVGCLVSLFTLPAARRNGPGRR